MKVACLLVPKFPLICELADQPSLQDEAVALLDEGGTRVVERTEAAAERGVRRGMSLRSALAHCPPLIVRAPRPALQAGAAETLIDALAGVSPFVEPQSPGMVYADLSGLERLYPSSDALDSAIRRDIPRWFQPRLGIAERRFTAAAAARAARPGATQSVADAEALAFLAPLPIEWLPLEAELHARLHLLGLETLGALAALPRSALEAQFGGVGGWAWDAARGLDPSPIVSRALEERIVEASEANPPLVSRTALHYSFTQLLARALRRPDLRQRLIRALRLSAVAENDQIWTRRQVLKQPSSDRESLGRTIQTIVEAAQFPGPIVRLSLELIGLTAEAGRQGSLFPGRIRRGEWIDAMAKQLKTRYGASPLKRLVKVEPWSRIPERRYALMDYDP